MWNGTGYESVYTPNMSGDIPAVPASTQIGIPAPNQVDPLAFDTPVKDLSKPPVSSQDPNSTAPPNLQMREIPRSSAAESWDADFGLAAPILDLTGAEPAPVADSLPIGQAIENQIDPSHTLEDAPLEGEIVRWYHVPWRFFTRGWENHAEFGLDGSTGNADTLAIQTGLEMRRKTDAYTLALDLDYRQANASGDTTENNGRFNLDYDRLLGDSSWTAFGKFGIEYDDFKAFDLRLNLNGGVGYYWIRNDRTNLITRFGSGASKEIGAPDDSWIPEAVFGIEADHQLTERQKIKAKMDYFPAWEDFSDFRLVTDIAWETLLDNSENLSLRIALTDRYDSTPQGAKENDFYYSLLMLNKF